MNLEKGKVTMVIPLYNKINVIRTTLESVVNYHGNAPFECIIVDDNSTDGSSEIAKEFECKYPDLFTYVRITHRGIYGPANARNFGIRLCNSEYICFLDADDELYEGHIDRSADFLNKYRYINIYGENHYERNTNNQLNPISYNKPLTKITDIIFKAGVGAGIGMWSFVYKTEHVNQILFSNFIGEDGIFLFTMLNRFSPFYIDMTKYAVIQNTEYRDTSHIHQNIANGNVLCEYYQETIKQNPDLPIKLISDDYRWELVNKETI